MNCSGAGAGNEDRPPAHHESQDTAARERKKNVTRKTGRTVAEMARSQAPTVCSSLAVQRTP